jgi:hypothetical protein
MVGTFAHSFDRETFNGSQNTRQDALKEGFQKLPQLESSPDMIYVGKRVPLDPGSSGLAEMILAAMRRRVREQSEGSSNQYLMRVNEHQLAELDDEIDRVVRAWLTKHNLQPTQSRMIAISEHPVPSPSMNGSNKASNGEVSDIGVGQFPLTIG